MGIEKQAEGTAVFVIALSVALGVFLSLVLVVMGSYQVSEEHVAVVVPQVDANKESPPVLTQGEQRRAWFQAMEKVIQVNNKEADSSNAGYKFDACFLANGQCAINARAAREEFEKTTFYFPPSQYTDSENHVAFYLNLKDGEMPHVVMRFVYVGKEWMYIERVLVLADDDFVLEDRLPEVSVRREAVSGNMVVEYGDLVVSDKLDVLKLITNAEKLAVRIEGRSGTVNLNEAMLESVKNQSQEILVMHQMMTEAIERALLATPLV